MSKVAEPSTERMVQAMEIMAKAIMEMPPQKARELLEIVRHANKKGA